MGDSRTRTLVTEGWIGGCMWTFPVQMFLICTSLHGSGVHICSKHACFVCFEHCRTPGTILDQTVIGIQSVTVHISRGETKCSRKRYFFDSLYYSDTYQHVSYRTLHFPHFGFQPLADPMPLSYIISAPTATFLATISPLAT